VIPLAHRVAHRVGHLARRFAGSLGNRPPAAADDAWAAAHLAPGEQALWGRMGNADRRHSIEVARRFVARRPGATPAEVAGALLHDCGKVEAGLGTLGRVAATVAGPRTARFRAYHDHEAIGARLALAAGSDAATVALIEGRGPAVADLLAADDV
jgi:hypothetical protein